MVRLTADTLLEAQTTPAETARAITATVSMFLVERGIRFILLVTLIYA